MSDNSEKNIGDSIIDGVKKTAEEVSEVAEGIYDRAAKALHNAEEAILGAGSDAKDAARKVVDNATDAVSHAGEAVVDAGSKAVDSAGKALNKAVDDAEDALKK